MIVYFFKRIAAIVILGILLSVTLKTNAQSNNHDEEKLEADALALAYIDCNHSLTYYYYKLEPENTILKKQVKELTAINTQMTINMKAKYGKDEALNKKFYREVQLSRKKLSKCMKYQNILDANAELERRKAENSK